MSSFQLSLPKAWQRVPKFPISIQSLTPPRRVAHCDLWICRFAIWLLECFAQRIDLSHNGRCDIMELLESILEA